MHRIWDRIVRVAVAAWAVAGAAPAADARQDADLPPLPPEAQIGEAAPALSVEHILRTGSLGSDQLSTLDLSSLRGRVVVLEFWATWCAPCISAIPHFNDLVEQFRDRPVVFISVTDETAEPVEKFLARRPIAGTVAIDTDRSLFLAYRTSAIPRTIIIDSSGIYRASLHPRQLTAQLIEAALAGQDVQQALEAPAEQPAEKPVLTAATQVIEAAPDTATADPVQAQDSTVPIAGPSASPGEVLFEMSLRASNQSHGKIEKWEQRLVARGCTARDLIAECTQTSPGLIVCDDGIDLDSTRYEATISLPAAAPSGSAMTVSTVLQELVSRAISIETYRDRRIVPILVVRPAAESAYVNIRDVTASQGASSLSWGLGTISAVRQPMHVLTERLSAMLRMPVVNETGLPGVYDWTVRCADDSLDAVGAALQEQLGLRAEVHTRQMDVVVVRRK
ncbi:MAG: hypothetical protein AMXMBFR58_30540 [Phycisphaerae bacterium]